MSNWPQIVLSSPFKTEPSTLPLSAFPDTFKKDVAKWAERMTNPDPFDREAPPRPLRRETVNHKESLIRQYASALVHQGDLEIEQVTGLEVLFTPERFISALRSVLERQDDKPTQYLFNFANSMRWLAKHYCKLDDATLEELAWIAKRCDPHTPRQMTQRNRDLLRQLDDPRNVAKLLCFPEMQLAKARKENNPFRAAKRVEVALCVALLIHCGLRSGTLRALEITDFHWFLPDHQGICHLSVPGHKTKTDRPHEYELAAQVADLLRVYVVKFRPRLPGATGPYLLPGQRGDMRSKNAFREGVKLSLLKEVGLVMNPHLFRHAIAKIVVEADPSAYPAVSLHLDHTTTNTTFAHYLGTEGKAATRHIDRLLDQAKNKSKSGI